MSRPDLTRMSEDELIGLAADLWEDGHETYGELIDTADPETRHALQDDLRRLAKDREKVERVLDERFAAKRRRALRDDDWPPPIKPSAIERPSLGGCGGMLAILGLYALGAILYSMGGAFLVAVAIGVGLCYFMQRRNGG